ncbi:hypothetical protein [Micromonospora echinaurantiaca]|uniref:hypothetical protein n=1 Tax=Micromonospora echinaurantiaca TaxID=47857 RepID=UPI003416B168
MSQPNRDRTGTDRSVELSRQSTGCVITARWRAGAEPVGNTGPDEIVVRVADDAAPDVRERGLTSEVLHRMEWQVDDMVAEFHQLPSAGAYQVTVRRYIEGRLAELARGAAGVGFESALLAVFEDLAGRGHADPLSALATATGRSPEALDHLLDVARQRRSRRRPS